MKVVAIGGGTGLSALLRGLKLHVAEPYRPAPLQPAISRLTAIVTVTDEGGSSGRLRRDFRVLPPGDVRNCLVALAEDEKLLTQLFNYRFSTGRGLRGHSLGNLLLTALTHLTHDFAQAVRVSSEVLAIRGEIFPATLSDVRLKALRRDGRVIHGESAITKTPVPIKRLYIVPGRCQPLPETLEAIREADIITLGPGSLYTSLIPNLLVQGIPEQIAHSKAMKVYIGNLMTQPGETRSYTASDHLRALQAHAGRNLFDYVILNSQPLPRALLTRYARQHAEPVAGDPGPLQELGVKAVCADLLNEDHLARHDSSRLARLVLNLAARRDTLRGEACQARSYDQG
jgi:uncharacterized cofD-like protein